MQWQRSLLEPARFEGVGVHTGEFVRVSVLPAEPNHGITFLRTDIDSATAIQATWENVTDSCLATTLSYGLNGSRSSIATVEHLMAALSGLGIDNAKVCAEGPEIPVLDGSAMPFVEGLLNAGISKQPDTKRVLVVKRDVEVKDGDRWARIKAGRGLQITCSIDFDHSLITTDSLSIHLNREVFLHDIAPARTFAFRTDIEMLRSRGLAQGGSLDNAVVIDGSNVLNPEGLRFPDEFVRHKILDAIGDIALLGLPIEGHLELHKTGHALNVELVRALANDPSAYEIVTADARACENDGPGQAAAGEVLA